MMTAKEAELKAIKLALAGGRTFGTKQHRVAIKNLATMLTATEDDGEIDAIVQAIGNIGNLSALQQKLHKAGVIDREKKGEVRQNIYKELLATPAS